MTDITVVMATYKQAKYLPQAIESIMQQSKSPNLIISDIEKDHKTTAAFLPYYQTYGPCQRMFTTSIERPSMWNQRREGLRWVEIMFDSGYMTFFDSDDVMLPGWLDRGLKVAEEIASRGKIPIVGPSYRMVDEKLFPMQDVVLPEFTLKGMLDSCIIPDFSITRTENLRIAFEAGCKTARELFTPQYSMYCTWLEMLKRFDCEVRLLPDIGFLYRQHHGGMHNRFKRSKRASRKNVEMVHKVAEYYFPEVR